MCQPRGRGSVSSVSWLESGQGTRVGVVVLLPRKEEWEEHEHEHEQPSTSIASISH